MARAALIDVGSAKVVNIIVLGGGDYTPPPGTIVVVSDDASIGDTYENGVFIKPPPIIVVPPPPDAISARPVSVHVNFKSNPSLNAAYSITAQALSSYENTDAQVRAFGTFPNGAAFAAIIDVNGIPHNFTTATFQSFYNAVAYYSRALASGLLPQSPLTIQ